MVDNINIRKVKSGDEKILAYIQTESWKNAFNTILSKEDLEKYSNIDKAIEMYTNLLSEDVGNGYILSINDIPHCMAYWGESRDEDMEEYSELICIHSISENWRRGYGSMMMEYILREIKKSGFEKVMLWVFEKNIRARSFYEKHGFVLTGKSKKFCNAVEVMYFREV